MGNLHHPMVSPPSFPCSLNFTNQGLTTVGHGGQLSPPPPPQPGDISVDNEKQEAKPKIRELIVS